MRKYICVAILLNATLIKSQIIYTQVELLVKNKVKSISVELPDTSLLSILTPIKYNLKYFNDSLIYDCHSIDSFNFYKEKLFITNNKIDSIIGRNYYSLVSSTNLYYYYDNSNLLQSKTKYSVTNNSIIEYQQYIYNNQNQIDSILTFKDGVFRISTHSYKDSIPLLSYEKYYYDTQNRPICIEEYFYDKNVRTGELIRSSYLQYNKDNRLRINETTYFSNDEIFKMKTHTIYYKNGLIKETYITQKNRKRGKKEVYKYTYEYY